jgi:hypothetical protein
MIDKQRILKVAEGSSCGLIYGTAPAFGWRKSPNPFIMITDLRNYDYFYDSLQTSISYSRELGVIFVRFGRKKIYNFFRSILVSISKTKLHLY